MFALRVLPLALIGGQMLLAQTPPCGRAIVTVGGAPVEDRFLAAPPSHVKASLLRALPAVGARPTKEDDLAIEAKSDGDLYFSAYTRNKEAGVKGRSGGMGASGTFKIRMTPDTQDGSAGTRVHIEFHKNAFVGRMGSPNQATPLMDETACLVNILSPDDPQQNPRGVEGSAPVSEQRAVVVPEGTPVKLLLREFLYSKNIKNRVNQPIVFEVAEDVSIGGVTAIRRGALGTGKFVDAKAARAYRRSAELEFVAEMVTAVDGQRVTISGATEKSSGAQKESTFSQVWNFSLALGWLDKGVETVMRAGSGFAAETTGEFTVQIGK